MREHVRTNLVAVVEGEHVIRPAGAFENTMGTAALAFDSPADAQQRSQNPTRLFCSATGSCRNREDVAHLWHGLTVFEPVGENAQRQRFRPRHGFALRRAVTHRAGNLRHFGDPTTVALLLCFNVKIHIKSENKSSAALPDFEADFDGLADALHASSMRENSRKAMVPNIVQATKLRWNGKACA